MSKKTDLPVPPPPPNTFRFRHWGAIDRIDLTIPDDEPGGVRVLMGDEGSGKSTIVQTLGALADDRPKFPQTPLDGHGRGTFEAPGGVVIEVFPTKTGPIRLGQLAVRILNGENMATLINPGLKGAKERSRARNTALCGMARLELTEMALEAITKGNAELRKVVPPGATLLDAADLVREKAAELAGEAKDAAEAAGIEATSAYAAAHEIDSSNDDPNGEFPTETPSVADAMKLLQASTRNAEQLRISYQARQDLELQKEELADAHGECPGERLSELRSRIGVIDEQLPGLQQRLGGLEEKESAITTELQTIRSAIPEIESEISELEQRLAVLRERHSSLDTRRFELEQELTRGALLGLEGVRRQVADMQSERARADGELSRLEEELRRWQRRQEIIEKPLDGYATAEQVEDADALIRYNERLVARAQQFQKALEFLTQHEQAKKRAQEAHERELWYRDIGWNIIPKVIADRLGELGIPGLDMRAGVLYAMHEKRGMIPFDELSPGQQVRWALKIALRGRTDGERAVLPFPQEAWDAMTPRAHALFRHEARRAHVWIYTATARHNGPLREESGIPEEEESFLLQLEEHGDDGLEGDDAERILIGWGENSTEPSVDSSVA